MPQGRESKAATRQILDRLGDKWSVLAIAAVLRGPRRFVDLRRDLGEVSHKVLTQVLRSLERDGFFSRHVLVASPLRVEYRITPLGTSFAELLQHIQEWSAVHIIEVQGNRAQYDINNPSKGLDRAGIDDDSPRR